MGPAALDEVEGNCNSSWPAVNVLTIVGSVTEVLNPDWIGREGPATPDVDRASSLIMNRRSSGAATQ